MGVALDIASIQELFSSSLWQAILAHTSMEKVLHRPVNASVSRYTIEGLSFVESRELAILGKSMFLFNHPFVLSVK